MKCLVLPGWGGSGPRHWQSIWTQSNPGLFEVVQQTTWTRPHRNDWIRSLERHMRHDEHRTTSHFFLVAHSLGCHLVASFAESQQRQTKASLALLSRVKGALLVAPPDLHRPTVPSHLLHSWTPVAETPLPFPTICVYSQNDALCSEQHALHLAHAWGATPWCAGPKGHINAESNLGSWDEGKKLLQNLIDGVVLKEKQDEEREQRTQEHQ